MFCLNSFSFIQSNIWIVKKETFLYKYDQFDGIKVKDILIQRHKQKCSEFQERI